MFMCYRHESLSDTDIIIDVFMLEIWVKTIRQFQENEADTLELIQQHFRTNLSKIYRLLI